MLLLNTLAGINLYMNTLAGINLYTNTLASIYVNTLAGIYLEIDLITSKMKSVLPILTTQSFIHSQSTDLPGMGVNTFNPWQR